MQTTISTHQFCLPNSTNNNYNIGKLFEHVAVQFLEQNNYIICQQNWRNKYGEIDCIATTADGKTIVIVEVKARAKDGKYSVRSSVDYNKKNQVYQMAQLYRQSNYPDLRDKSFRFDVIRITFKEVENNYIGRLEHIKNALHHGFTPSFTNKKKIYRNRNSKSKKSF
jgi:putative endonuclease